MNSQSDGLLPHMHRAVGNDPVYWRATELLNQSKKSLASSVCGPLLDVLDGEAFRKVGALPQLAEMAPLTKYLGYSLTTKEHRLPTDAQSTFLHLSDYIASLPTPSGGVAALAVPPTISTIETCEDGLNCCAERTGIKIDSACPGTFVRIVGRGFSPVPSHNTVRFGDARASLIKASPEELVVMVPFVGLAHSQEKPEIRLGKCNLSVTTRGGGAETQFKISDLPKTKGDLIGSWVDGNRRVLAKLLSRLATNRAPLNSMLSGDTSGSTQRFVDEIPFLAATLAKQLDALPGMMPMLGNLRPEAERMIGGAIVASGNLDDLNNLEAMLDDPTSALLEGSGIVDAICAVHEFVLKVIAITVAVALVLIVVIVALILVAFATEVGIVLIPALVAILSVIVEWAIFVIFIEMMFEVVVTIVYIVAKALQYVGKGISALLGY